MTDKEAMNILEPTFQLTLTHVLDRMRTVHGQSLVVTQQDAEGTLLTRTFAETAERIDRLGAALASRGVGAGVRVASLAWNSQEHLEVYYAVPCLGATLHTANLRLSPEQIAFTIQQAQDRIVIVDHDLATSLAAQIDQLDCVEEFIVIGDGEVDLPRAVRYEDVLAEAHSPISWPQLDENGPAALCFTSGTVGVPKGVVYSHRCLMLHTLVMAAHDQYRISERDRVLAVVPMFHAMGWNFPFVAGMLGADLLLPRQYLQAPHLVRLVEQMRATASSGVPTIWMDVLRYAQEHDSDLSSLHTVVCGGTQVPPSLMETYERDFGVQLVQGWGMTETLPGATMAYDPVDHGTSGATAAESQERKWSHRSTAGRIAPLYEVRIKSLDGKVLPSDGEAVGEIQVRGAMVTTEYLGRPEGTEASFDDGWLCTGDVGTVDPHGWVRITDRLKDVIKSGGEWISSADVESALMAHPAVNEAAVVAMPDPRWSERPLAYVVVNTDVDDDELREFLAGKVHKFWVPDAFVRIDAVPRTSTGKFDKKVLRGRLDQDLSS